MKIIFMLIILFSSVIYAKSTFFIKSGLNYSTTIQDERNEKTKYKVGGEIFFSWNYKISENFGFDTGFGLNDNGYSQYDGGDDNLIRYEAGTIAIESPLILQYYISDYFLIYSGVFFSFPLIIETGNSQAGPIPNMHLIVDLGGVLGISYQYKKILFELRFLQGVFNQQFMFMFGHKF